MKQSLLNKLVNLTERLQELDALLADPSVISDQNRFRELSKEHAEVRPVVDCFKDYIANQENISSSREMLKDNDKEIRELAAGRDFETDRIGALQRRVRRFYVAPEQVWSTGRRQTRRGTHRRAVGQETR